LTALVVHPCERPLVGSVPVPSDKSIGHRALLLASICEGKSRIKGFAGGEDNRSTAAALRAMGVTIEEGDREIVVLGVGLFGLHAPAAPLDCGNSGTTMRLLLGLLAPQPFEATLTGDESLSRRPMMRVIGPLRARGARITGRAHPTKADEITAPLTVHGLPEGEYLTAIEHRSDVASAQVKSAILLSGLYAHGATLVREPSLSRDHTERMLLSLGVPLETMGPIVRLDPAGWDGHLPAFDLELPGDLSAAAFVVTAAQVVDASKVVVRGVGTNPTRTGFLEIARDMGAGIGLEPHGERGGEPVADLHAWQAPLRAIKIGGELVPRAVDEIPIACVLAARAAGETVITDAAELRVKESDRLSAMASVLRAFGVRCEEKPDGLVIEGRSGPLEPVKLESRGDHRIAMAAAVLALAGRAPSTIDDVDCIATSFPRFVGTLRALGATVEVSS
jgi:3-phosphoshikimate 1-carboxyvinyltransferase